MTKQLKRELFTSYSAVSVENRPVQGCLRDCNSSSSLSKWTSASVWKPDHRIEQSTLITGLLSHPLGRRRRGTGEDMDGFGKAGSRLDWTPNQKVFNAPTDQEERGSKLLQFQTAISFFLICLESLLRRQYLERHPTSTPVFRDNWGWGNEIINEWIDEYPYQWREWRCNNSCPTDRTIFIVWLAPWAGKIKKLNKKRKGRKKYNEETPLDVESAYC